MMPALTTGFENVALDHGALAHDTEGFQNIAIGNNALERNTTGTSNVASGTAALASNTTGALNVASGVDALLSNVTGNFNVASGDLAMFNSTGDANVASGFRALESNSTGSFNVASGYRAGFLTTGSNNIDISNEGVAGEAGTTRIGTEGTQTKAYMAGIHSTSVSGCPVQVNAEGQLGCGPAAGGSGPTAIATFASFEGVGSGHCLKYTELAGQGTGSCPGATSGFSVSGLLAGPTPAGGATVTNLYADSSATVKGSDTALVAVIDNTTGATLLSCKVDSATVNHRSNTTESGSAVAGENIEVKVTATPANGTGNSKSWRVRFRY
jgi:hypothetical protein